MIPSHGNRMMASGTNRTKAPADASREQAERAALDHLGMAHNLLRRLGTPDTVPHISALQEIANRMVAARPELTDHALKAYQLKGNDNGST